MSNNQTTINIKDHLGTPVSQDQALLLSQRITQTIDDKYPNYYNKRRYNNLSLPIAVPLTTLLILFFCSYWYFDHTRPQPLSLMNGKTIAFVETQYMQKQIEFNDGSKITIEANTQLEPKLNVRSRVEWKLLKGKANFEVHRAGRHWTIHAGTAKVEVIGTKFSVQLDRQKLFVRVKKGKVKVSTKTITRILTAGEKITVATERVHQDITPKIQKPSIPKKPSKSNLEIKKQPLRKQPSLKQRPKIDSPSIKNMPKEEIPTGKQRLSEGPESRITLPTRQPPRLEPHQTQDSLSQLTNRADTARLAQDWDKASQILNLLIKKYPNSEMAPIASLSKARLDLLQRNQTLEAFLELQRTEKLHPPIALQEEILALKVIAAGRLGKKQQAQSWAKLYLGLFRQGKFRKEVEQWQ